jgi:hypothetical protein
MGREVFFCCFIRVQWEQIQIRSQRHKLNIAGGLLVVHGRVLVVVAVVVFLDLGKIDGLVDPVFEGGHTRVDVWQALATRNAPRDDGNQRTVNGD